MKYHNALIFAICFMFLYQIPVNGELIINIAPPKAEGNNKETFGNKTAKGKNQKDDILKFKNKDALHGKMISILPGKGILWNSRDVKQNILFLNQNVTKIELGNNIPKTENYNASVLLTNDDILDGKLKSMDKKVLILETRYAGIIKIDSHMVKGIYPGEEISGLLYSGPNDMNGWEKISNNKDGKISISEGVLSMNRYSGVGRDMKLTDLSKIDFKFEIAGNCQMQVLFYGDKARSNPKNCYVMYLSSGYIYLQRYGKNGRSGNLGNVHCRAMRSGKGRITIMTDKKKKTVTLMFNGVIIKKWIDTAFPGKGTFVSFLNQSQGTLKIKEIEITEWNGKNQGKGNDEEVTKEDTLIFINGDQVTGKLNQISQDIALFKTDYAELKIPLKRIKHIKTAVDNQHKAKRNAGDVRFSFINGNKLTLNLEKIENGKISGNSENFGKLLITLNVFKAIKLNIYDEDD